MNAHLSAHVHLTAGHLRLPLLQSAYYAQRVVTLFQLVGADFLTVNGGSFFPVVPTGMYVSMAGQTGQHKDRDPQSPDQAEVVHK
ncbi:hypothetical protein [Streptomyces sp. NPDC101165]|uniref:hypothetical protein n=1 Tax=Streptomyces sp. NPDC101165 TaxID=3366119 RepID=UPI00382CC6C5